MSVNMQKVYDIAKSVDSKLTATMFSGYVAVHHDDGSHFFFKNAFAARYTTKVDSPAPNGVKTKEKENWIVVFTEHHGFHVFAEVDLHHISASSEDLYKFVNLTDLIN